MSARDVERQTVRALRSLVRITKDPKKKYAYRLALARLIGKLDSPNAKLYLLLEAMEGKKSE